jgi:hypothetical protein
LDRKNSSTKLHIRANWTGFIGFATWLPPTQMKVLPGCQSKTPVAQMHFASEYLLSKETMGYMAMGNNPSKLRENLIYEPCHLCRCPNRPYPVLSSALMVVIIQRIGFENSFPLKELLNFFLIGFFSLFLKNFDLNKAKPVNQ